VPTGDGRATRCFWPQDLTDSLDGAGFETHWIRPRTVLSPEAVNRALRADPGRLETLVETETRLEVEREGDSAAYHLVVSAERR
jgi:hypothetical protein